MVVLPYLHPGDRVVPRGHSRVYGSVCFVETDRTDGQRLAWVVWDDDSIAQHAEGELRLVERAAQELAA